MHTPHRPKSCLLRVLALLLPLVGCDPDTIRVQLPAYSPQIDEYEMDVVEIETLDNVGRLEGRATTLVGGVDMVIDYTKSTIEWNDGGQSVAFGAFKSDGVLIPEDFDSLAMVSIYFNIEGAMLFFESLGMGKGLLGAMNTYYWPQVEIIEAGQNGEADKMDMVDNAFYLNVSTDDRGFYVFPYEDFQWLPLSMNTGVMTHEYAHGVFDWVVKEPNRDWYQGGMTPAGLNFLFGLNEGLSDVYAVAQTGDGNYMEHSIDPTVGWEVNCNGGYTDLVRDVTDPRFDDYVSFLDGPPRGIAPDAFCPYDIGSYVAATSWEMARRLSGVTGEEIPDRESRRVIAQKFFEAEVLTGEALASDFELWDFFSALITVTEDSSLRQLFCGVLEDRYAMYYTEVEGC